MKAWLAEIVFPFFSFHRLDMTYEADYDDAAEMVEAAVALRIQGCQVRMCVESHRLFVTVPWSNPYRMRLARARSGR